MLSYGHVKRELSGAPSRKGMGLGGPEMKKKGRIP
jgi:hypothetical protein